MLAVLLSVSVSVVLLIWLLGMKKHDPFPKFTVVKLLIFGAVAMAVAGIVTVIAAIINLLIQIGPDDLKLLFDAEGAKQVLRQITSTSRTVTAKGALLGFVRTFIIVGLVEEIFKYLGAKIVMKKEGVVYTWKDALLCMAIVAIGFQIIEDVGYSSSNVLLAIFRALTPFHFTFGVIMGYFYGLGKVKRSGLHSVLAVLVPALIHTLYDYSINLVTRSDDFFVLTLAVSVFMFALTVFMILKLRKWHKNGTLDTYI